MRASPTLASLGPYSTLTLKWGCQVPSGYHYHLFFQNRLVGNRHVTFSFKVRLLNFFFSWIKVFSWKLLCKVNESRIYPVYEAKKLAPPCRLTHQVSSPTWDHNPDSHPLFISPTYPRLSEGFQRAEIKNHSLQELITNRVKYYLFCDVLIMTEE